MMKKENSTVRSKWVTVRMNEAECSQLEKNRKSSTEKNNSNYLRKLALNEPITKLVRNRSIDEATLALIGLKKELNFIGHNFNQVVHKLHTLDRIPEFRDWVEKYESSRLDILGATNDLLHKAHQILQQWSQK